VNSPQAATWPSTLRFPSQAFADAPGQSAEFRQPASTWSDTLSKVPQVTLGFWIIKIAATTLGETGGDALSMSLNLGYALSTAIFFVLFAVTVAAQIRATRFHPFLYWGVIVATTLAGTTLADFCDRSLGIGYAGGSTLLFVLVLAILSVWRWTQGSVSVNHITSPKVEAFYWATILASNTLGTALGDWVSDSIDSFIGGVAIFAAAIAVVALLYFFTKIPRTLLFWSAFILTRPLGATLGDTLTKPIADHGLNLSRFTSSAVIAVFMIACILLFPQPAGEHPGAKNP
jgi:uncharacterized membrane-anchored protein